jgi:[protein-PII] uridylyltransferase
VRDALALGADDLDTATSLLSARLVAGDPSPAANLAAGAFDRWRKRSPQVLWQVADRVEQRHEKAGDNAFRPEPDLKEGRGGLRDVHALRWAEQRTRSCSTRTRRCSTRRTRSSSTPLSSSSV